MMAKWSIQQGEYGHERTIGLKSLLEPTGKFIEEWMKNQMTEARSYHQGERRLKQKKRGHTQQALFITATKDHSLDASLTELSVFESVRSDQ